ncbi:YdcP family protein [Furfurilactobacillus milii]|uniref:DUF961 domain-containing protein n=1 Tax=Furfurilactobacillus milii TaxID=2888272 RepID=A0A6N9HZA4_9LACO|nr:YdcP family protein [Furfurilactobacillus milii]MYV16071.1 DUF961 domain-containing protein [Furfurilactobacillus milii]
MRLPEGIQIDPEATFGTLKFSAMRRERFNVDEDGALTTDIKERTFDLKSLGQGMMVQVSIPASAGEKNFDYNQVVELVNPVLDTVANIEYRTATATWYMKADDLVAKSASSAQKGKPLNDKA